MTCHRQGGLEKFVYSLHKKKLCPRQQPQKEPKQGENLTRMVDKMKFMPNLNGLPVISLQKKSGDILYLQQCVSCPRLLCCNEICIAGIHTYGWRSALGLVVGKSARVHMRTLRGHRK